MSLAPVLAAEMENKHRWEGAGSGVAVPAGAVPVQLVPGVPAHSLPPPVFSRESRIPEDSYARMSQWPGVPAAFSSPFPEVPSGCIHMTGPAGKQNLCLLDTTHAWHHSSCQGVMFIRHVPGISWVARCLEAGSMPWVPGKEPRTSQQTQRGAERRGQHHPPWSYGGVTALNTGGARQPRGEHGSHAKPKPEPGGGERALDSVCGAGGVEGTACCRNRRSGSRRRRLLAGAGIRGFVWRCSEPGYSLQRGTGIARAGGEAGSEGLVLALLYLQ